jgi:hypothetical protein
MDIYFSAELPFTFCSPASFLSPLVDYYQSSVQLAIQDSQPFVVLISTVLDTVPCQWIPVNNLTLQVSFSEIPLDIPFPPMHVPYRFNY